MSWMTIKLIFNEFQAANRWGSTSLTQEHYVLGWAASNFVYKNLFNILIKAESKGIFIYAKSSVKTKQLNLQTFHLSMLWTHLLNFNLSLDRF